MRIIGTGVDIVETARIEASIERHGTRFLERIFTGNEIAYCGSMKYAARHYAARFAAKEAVSKAFGTGILDWAGWREIEVTRSEEGRPTILLHGGMKETAQKQGIDEVMISLSHADHYSVASAIVVGKS